MKVQNEVAVPRVIIIGGGFAGLAAAKQLARSAVEVTVVDRRNHHVFQPLLYQVASSVLSPADIASPIRHILRDQRNCSVLLAEVKAIDLKAQRVVFSEASVGYDWLILAAGATHSYFGRDDWELLAPGLKSLEDATEIRRRILLAFESAEFEGSEEQRKAALTFAVVGGGPTGVELAGAIQEIAARSIMEDFRNIDTTTTRVVLFEGGDRLLSQLPEKLSSQAKSDLEAMGVEVFLSTRVTEIKPEGVWIGEAFFPVANVFWAAGVRGSSLGATLGVEVDRAGRVKVQSDLSVPGYPQVFVVGDLAAASCGENAQPVPGVAQAALQMGRYAGKIISREVSSNSGFDKESAQRKAFVYKDKGSMATIGRARAVAVIGGWKFTGLFAWLLWSLVHVLALVSFRNKVAVVFGWIWHWLSWARGARLITGDADLKIKTPISNDRVYLHDQQELETINSRSE